MKYMKSRHLRRTLLIAAVLAVTAGCAEESDEARRERLHLPPADYIGDAQRGTQLFASNCSTCHGVNARGSQQGPPLVHKYYEPGHHGDYSFHAAVRDGVKQHHWQFGDMPPQPSVSPTEVADIIRYVRGLQVRAGIR